MDTSIKKHLKKHQTKNFKVSTRAPQYYRGNLRIMVSLFVNKLRPAINNMNKQHEVDWLL